MLHQAEGLPLHPVWNAYLDEKLKFLKPLKIPIDKAPKNSITIHVM